MFGVGRSLESVLMTTTTKMHSGRTAGFATLVGATDDEISDAIDRHHRVLAWHAIDGGKARGIDPSRCDLLSTRVPVVLVEADGARRHPFTAPGPFEPVIPSLATHVVACIGADAIGRCIGDQCHRPLRVAAVAGCGPYDRLTPSRAATVISSERGSRKGCPPHAAFSVAITKVDDTNIDLVDELTSELAPLPVIAIARAPSSREDRSAS